MKMSGSKTRSKPTNAFPPWKGGGSAPIQTAPNESKCLTLRDAMSQSLGVLIYFPDGKSPEESPCDVATLSPRWSAMCSEIISSHGPVFRYNMGGTLAHFDVEMAGPIGRLLIHKIRCIDFWVRRAVNAQAQAVIDHFTDFFRRACESSGSSPDAKAFAPLRRLDHANALILFDYCNPAIGEDDKAAMAQLAVHLANAYLAYCENVA